MKNEGELNQYLSKEFKKIRWLDYLKASDKYSPGVSDFLLWAKGQGTFLETKFIRKFPGPNVRLLNHPFTTKQISFLNAKAYVAGCTGWGGIGVWENETIYCIPEYYLPERGNWKTREFLEFIDSCDEDLYYDRCFTFSFSEVELMVKRLFMHCHTPPRR